MTTPDSSVLLAPSILAADFAQLGADVDAVLRSGADIVHFDVMDNHYVPNLSFGPIVCEALRQYGIQAPIDVHLMIEPVDALVPAFAEAGATYITFHPEASRHVSRTLQLIRDCGCKPGLVLNPASSLTLVDHVWDDIDLLLLMSVNPGFGGQSFLPATLSKIAQARREIDSRQRDIRLEVDGGVKVNNCAEIVAAGADMLVAGSAIFSAADDSESRYGTVVSAFRQQIETGVAARTRHFPAG